MARVLLVTAARDRNGDGFALRQCRRLQDSARHDPFKNHRLTDSPHDADIILFAEHDEAGPYFEDVRRHPLVKAYRRKCFIYSAVDKPIPFLPGVYPSIEDRWFRNSWVRSGHYLGILENEELFFDPPGASPRYLYSFVGSMGRNRVRRDLQRLRDPRGLVVDVTRDKKRMFSEIDKNSARKSALWRDFRRDYASIMKQSSFVLCPRGAGPSTWRLFETMMCGRVPVIISDSWVAPEGPRWDAFSIRVQEAEIPDVPAILEAREHRAAEMGVLARRAWSDWFSGPVSFHWIVEACLDIQRAQQNAGRPDYRPHRQLFRPYHLCRYLLTRGRLLRERKKLVL